MNPLLKKILIAVGILLVVFVAYRMFFASEPEEPLSSETVSGLPVEDGDLLSLLLQLKSLKLSDELLADPTFVTLQDFTVELAPEPVGRRNPFAVIGAVEAPVASTSTSSASTP
ncbi:MAG: hypothetical protein RLY47_216 [Candidatus Parcubacteria bacterium]|jgi:hypothetical protein